MNCHPVFGCSGHSHPNMDSELTNILVKSIVLTIVEDIKTEFNDEVDVLAAKDIQLDNKIDAAVQTFDIAAGSLQSQITNLVPTRDAYTIAKDSGFVGTEAQWLASLKGDKGLKGDTGERGPIGLKGDDGLDGAIGKTGPKGDKGETGDIGPKGDTGAKGATGNIGPIGPIGETGLRGLKGDKGDKGDTGATGLTGTKGDTGPRGLPGKDGETGARGLQGPIGIQGATGIQGPKGDTGSPGLQGIRGVQGIRGMSPYEQAVSEGFNGTVTQWLTSLKPTEGTLQALTRFMSNDADTNVTVPELGNIPSLQGHIKQMFENGGLPATPFATKALMEASALVDGAYAVVTNETSLDLNGLYEKFAGSWVFSNYNTLLRGASAEFMTALYESGGIDILKAIQLGQFTVESYIHKEYGDLVRANNIPELIASIYYEIDPDAAQIEITGWGSRSYVALYAFYDENKGFIESSFGRGQEYQHETILRADIPTNAKYIRYTAWLGKASSIKGVLTTENIPSVAEALLYSAIPRDSANRLKEFGTVFNNTLGYYIRTNGNYMKANSDPNLTGSDFFELDKEAEVLKISGYGMGVIALYALYDVNKAFISASIGDARGRQLVVIPMNELPENAYYIRFTGYNGYYDFIEGVKIRSINDEIDERMKESLGIDLDSILITGASLAYDGNTWFGSANEKLKTNGINKARNGYGKPSTDAENFWRGDFITDAEFQRIDVFTFQYANVAELDSVVGLKPTVEDYVLGFDLGSTANPFRNYTEAQCLDYILKFLQVKCYAQKDNPSSKWFGTQHGKPFRVMFVTHWHDARTYYNEPIRDVAARWGAAVCEFDKKIGFSKDTPLPDGTQVSVLYAQDTQVVDDVTYGWHPKRGASSDYIQNRMASIYKQAIIEWFGI